MHAQLAHQRAAAQASALVKSPDDMQIGALPDDVGEQQEPVLARLQALEQLFSKGEGKGSPGSAPFRPPSGYKGGGKGGKAKVGKGAPGAIGAPGAGAGCWHCGKPGHRRSECAAFTAHLQAQGKGQGAGLASRALNEFGEDAPSGAMGSLYEEEAGAAERCLSGGPEGAPAGTGAWRSS